MYEYFLYVLIDQLHFITIHSIVCTKNLIYLVFKNTLINSSRVAINNHAIIYCHGYQTHNTISQINLPTHSQVTHIIHSQKRLSLFF